MNNSDLIKKLQNCLAECNNCADACLDEENVKMMVDCIRLDRECANLCNAAINAITSNARHSQKLIDACADLCRQCADECAKHDHDHCRHCAEAFKECAEACANYSMAEA